MTPEPARKKQRLNPPDQQVDSVPGFARWNLEQIYERQVRKKQKAERPERLLVRTREEWKENRRFKAEDEEDDDYENTDGSPASRDGDEDSGIADLESKAEPEKPKISAKKQILLAKEELARLAGHISENPEENVGQLTTLRQLTQSEVFTIRKLALGTLLAVYKDIIPGYRIRPLPKDDVQGKVSKEVKKLRTFEQTLLSGYREYVHDLSRLLQQPGGSDNGPASLSSVAISCACNLLTSVPHFNFRNDLISILVRQLSLRQLTPLSIKCLEAMEQLFTDDEDGNASLEAVSQLTKMMKAKNYQVHEGILNSFLHLRLLSEFAHKASTNSVDKAGDDDQKGSQQKAKREFRTKKERKTLRERKQVEKEMKEADAVVSYEERDKNQAETLKLVFLAYFRILKERVQHLMGPVLEGLAKYSHLINQDFFGDVLEALKDLLREAEISLPDDNEAVESEDATRRDVTRERLLCIITAFALSQGQHDVAKSANVLHLDLKLFITYLYRTLLPLAMETVLEVSAKSAHLPRSNGLHTSTAKDTKVNVATTAVLLLRSLQSVLLPPASTRSVPPIRLAAFVKQLMTLSLHLPQKSATAVLELLRQVAKTNGNKIAGLWNTEERKGDGVFDALSGEVESSNPFATTVWEGEVLSLHYDPKIRDAVKSVGKTIVEARG